MGPDHATARPSDPRGHVRGTVERITDALAIAYERGRNGADVEPDCLAGLVAMPDDVEPLARALDVAHEAGRRGETGYLGELGAIGVELGRRIVLGLVRESVRDWYEGPYGIDAVRRFVRLNIVSARQEVGPARIELPVNETHTWEPVARS